MIGTAARAAKVADPGSVVTEWPQAQLGCRIHPDCFVVPVKPLPMQRFADTPVFTALKGTLP